MKNVIVTGANGFIGRYVTKRLCAGDYRVVALSRQAINSSDGKLTELNVDLSDDVSVKKNNVLIPQSDILVHLAADISVPGNAITVGNNIKSMQSAIEIAQSANIKHFILLSSIPLIGDIQYVPIDEAHPVNPKTSYHWSKYLCEKMLIECNDKFHRSTIIRIPSPIGVGMRNNTFFGRLVYLMIHNQDVEIYGSGSRIQSYIDVRDIADAVFNVAHKEITGLFLINGERELSNLQLAHLIRNVVGSSSIIYTGRHEDCEENDRWIISAQKANRQFGYKPNYSIEDTLKWVITESYFKV